MLISRDLAEPEPCVHIETLKTFCDLVEAGSFDKAAQLNFISQSAVSQQLKALETRYGRALLERGRHRGVTLTEAGTVFYGECKDLLERFRVLEERLRAPATAIAGTVRIATVYSIGLHELPPYVTRFMKAHPRVKVHIEYSRTDKVCDACASNALDFGIVAFPLRRANVAVIPWHEETLVLVCAPEHRLARRRKISLQQLHGEPFIAFERDIPTRRTIDRILKAHKVSVNTVMEFDNIETVKRAVEIDAGVAIVPSATVLQEVKQKSLVVVPFRGKNFTRPLAILHRKGRVLTPAMRKFIDTLTTELVAPVEE